MNLLKEYGARYPSPEAAVQAYAAEMEARFPRTPMPSTPMNQWVQCDWVVEYQKAGEKTGVAIALLLAPFGHFSVLMTKQKFRTYHWLTTREARKLRRAMHVRKALLPFATFGTVAIGFLFFFFLISTAIFLPTSDTPLTLGGILKLAGMFGAALIMFVATLKIQKAIAKMGRPPHTTEFTDQRVKLAAVQAV